MKLFREYIYKIGRQWIIIVTFLFGLTDLFNLDNIPPEFQLLGFIFYTYWIKLIIYIIVLIYATFTIFRENKKENLRLIAELNTIKTSKPELDLFFQGEIKSVKEINIYVDKFPPPIDIEKELEPIKLELRNRTIMNAERKGDPFPFLLSRSNSIAADPHLLEYKRYFQRVWNHNANKARYRSIQISLKNNGHSKATNIKITICIPNLGYIWDPNTREKWFFDQIEPTKPERFPNSANLGLSMISKTFIDPIGSINTHKDINGPIYSDKNKEITYEADLLLHTKSETRFHPIEIFINQEVLDKKIEISYSIICEEISEPQTGSLFVIFKEADIQLT